MTTAPIATALIADDEVGPRAQLAAALAELWPQLRVVAEAANGTDAWDAWLEHEPQLCFLDIRMARFTGIEVAQRIGARAEIVFVCAPGDHALAAFDAAGVDYLLKPIEMPALRAALERVQVRLAGSAAPTGDLYALLERLAGQVRKPAPLDVIEAGRDLTPVRVSDAIYFEADARATRVVLADGEFSVRTPLRELLAVLDPAAFWQVHRSAVVNRRHIAGALRLDDGSMVLALRGRPERLPVARPFQGCFDGSVMSPAPSP
jgi:DNA-binding LytR/AlgR family response regulator